MRAILLAGGQGTRLRPLTLNTPKPVVPIFDRPFLQYQIDVLRQVPEIDEIVLSLNYQPQRIQEVFGDGSALGVRIRYGVEPEPLGTGGAIRFAAGDYRGGPLIVFNGDVFTSVDLAATRRRCTASVKPPRDDRADARGESVGIRAGRNRRTTATSSRSSKSRSPTRSAATPSTPASTCSNPDLLDRIPLGTAVLGRARLFPVAHPRPADVRRARVERLLARHRYAGQVPAGARRHHGGPVSSGAVSGQTPGAPWCPRRHRSPRRRSIESPCFVGDGRGHRPRHPHRREHRRRQPAAGSA